MKLINFFTIILYMIHVSLINAVKTTEYCLKSREACQEVYGQNSKQCDDMKCSPEISVKCGQFCTTSVKACEQYNEMKRSLLIRSTIIPIANQEERSKFVHFNKNIKICRFKPNPVEPSDFCVKKSHCFIKKELVYNTDIINLMEPIECPCENSHSIKCANNYCSKYRHSCAELDNMNKNLIKKCRNMDRIKYQKLFSF